MRRLAPQGEKDALVRSMVPLGRMGTTDDIARLAMFLGSDAANYISGTVIACDGGAQGQLSPMVAAAADGNAEAGLETQQEKAWVMGSGLHTIKETNHDRDESDEGAAHHGALRWGSALPHGAQVRQPRRWSMVLSASAMPSWMHEARASRIICCRRWGLASRSACCAPIP
jgi:hypothetical protein